MCSELQLKTRKKMFMTKKFFRFVIFKQDQRVRTSLEGEFKMQGLRTEREFVGEFLN